MALYHTLTDQELAGSLRAGDHLAFRELYNRYWRILLETAYKRLDSTEAAEEVVQDLFVSLFVKKENLMITSTLEGYLKNALKYKIFDIFRSQSIHNKYIDAMIGQRGITNATPEHELQIKELKLTIDQATQKMPKKCREVFMMSRMENLSNKSIAQKLSISVSTVEKHISKALYIIKTDLKGHHLSLILAFFYFNCK